MSGTTDMTEVPGARAGNFTATHWSVVATAGGNLAGTAAAPGLTENAVRVALHRLRRRFGELLRGHITPTVDSPVEVDEEIRQLVAALST